MNKLESDIFVSTRTTTAVLLAAILAGCENSSPTSAVTATQTVVACPLAVRFVSEIPECSALMREACNGQCGVGEHTRGSIESSVSRGRNEIEATAIALRGYCAHLRQLKLHNRMHLAKCVPTL